MRRVFGKAFSSFFQDNGFKLSASLSYYTIFSLGPALLIVLSVLGIFFGHDAVQGRIFGQIESLTGPLVAKQIQDILKNIEFNGDNIAGLVTGILILFLGSTGVFTELQDSINYLWSVRPDRKKGVLKFFLNRFIFHPVGIIDTRLGPSGDQPKSIQHVPTFTGSSHLHHQPRNDLFCHRQFILFDF